MICKPLTCALLKNPLVMADYRTSLICKVLFHTASLSQSGCIYDICTLQTADFISVWPDSGLNSAPVSPNITKKIISWDTQVQVSLNSAPRGESNIKGKGCSSTSGAFMYRLIFNFVSFIPGIHSRLVNKKTNIQSMIWYRIDAS